MMSKVVLVSGSDVYENTMKILRALKSGFLGKVKSPMLIKPNLVYDKEKEGVTTKVEMIKAILDFAGENVKLDRIIIGEGSSFDTENAFKNLGYYDAFENVELIDFNRDESEPLKIIDPLTGSPITIKISKTALQCRFVISCALLKTHDHAIATLSLKNMMGVIVGREDKERMHGKYPANMTKEELQRTTKEFHHNIVSVVKRVQPSMAIIDGTVGIEGDGPINGSQKVVNIGIGGFDAVAVDAVSAYLMGFDPYEIGYIYLSEKEGLGTADLARISVSREDWTSFRKKFKTHKDYYYMRFEH